MLETTFEKKAVKRLRRLPNSWWPDKQQIGSIRGLPDRMGCVNGVFCALEFKINEKEAMKNRGRIVLQKHILKKIEEAGGFGAIVYPANWFLVYEELINFCGVNHGEIRN